MPGINDFREQYPQYNDLTDDELTEALWNSDPTLAEEMDREVFNQRFRGAPIETVETPTATISEKIDGQLGTTKDPLTTSIAEEEPGFLSNAGRLAGERLAELGGNLIGGLRELVEPASDWIEENTNSGMGVWHGSGMWEDDPYPDRGLRYYSYEDIKADPKIEAWIEENRWSNSIPRWLKEVELGGEKRYTPEQIKEDYANGEYDELAGSTAGFIFESGIESVPDMIAAIYTLPAYITSRAGEMGEARAKNKGKEQADGVDVLEAFVPATGSAILERIGAKGVFGQDTVENIGKEAIERGLKEVVDRGLQGAKKEALTEAVQEGFIEYVGERFGTDAQMSVVEGLERGAWGALAGGGFGGTVAAGVETVSQVGDTLLQRVQPDDVLATFEQEGALEPKVEPETEAPVPTMVEEDIMGPEVVTEREPIDPRLKRSGFREGLLAMTTDLVEGGGIALIPDPNFRPGESTGDIRPGDPQYPMIRTPSMNPDWFQSIAADEGISVNQTINAVRKALDGIRMGPREQRVVQGMLDHMTEMRTMPNELEAARAELEAARFDRREGIQPMAPIEVYDTLGETFADTEYLSDMDFTARAIFDLAEEVELYGGNPDPILEADTSNEQTITDLETLLEEIYGNETMQASDVSQTPEQDAQPQTDETFTGPERRVDAERRERISRMTPDQVYQELYTDQMTGLGNRRGFDEAIDSASAVASIDGDYLKAVNDNMGHEAGDAMLAGIGKAIQKVAGIDGYRVGGDEFFVLGDNPQQLEQMMQDIQAELDTMRIDNDRGTMTGFKITAGVGTDRASADLAMEDAKKARPAKRGDIPDNMTLKRQKKAEVIDLGMDGAPGADVNAAGTQYIPLIDKVGDLPLTPDNEYRLGDGRIVRIPKKAMRREHIIAKMESMFGIGIYEGRVKGKTRLGFYRLGQGSIRIKHRNQIEVAAHEVAHWIDDRHPWVAQLYQQKRFAEEIAGVSYDAKLDFEGYAEFMRLWFTQDVEARNRAPQFYDAWMAELKKHPDLADKIGQLQEMMHAWHLQGVRKRLASKIGSQALPWSERFREARRGAMDKILTQAFDRLRPIKQAERAMQGELGEGVQSAWKSFTLAKGSRAIMEAVYLRGTVGLAEDGSMAFTGKGLKDIFAPVEDRIEQMQLYMVGRRALELLSQGRENLFRVDEIRDALELGQTNPDFAQVFDEFQAFNKRMMDFYEAMGILGSDTREAIEEMNQNYVPFNRIVEAAQDGKVKTQSGGTPFQRLRGGTGNINDVLESTIANHSHLITFAMNNRAKRTFYDMIDRNENQEAGQFAQKVAKEMRPRNIPKSEIERAIAHGMGMTVSQFKMAQEGFSMDGHEDLDASMVAEAVGKLDEFVKLFEPGIAPEGNIDVVIRNGKKEYYEVHDTALLDALANFGAQPTNLGLQMLGGFSNLLRRGVTSWPGFQVRNFMRDSGSAWTLSRGQTIPLVRPLQELSRRFISDDAYWDFVINGGGIIGRMQADGFNADKVVFDPDSLLDKYDELLGFAEYANRIAEFKALTDKGVHPTEAAFAGRQISTDFAMRGRSDVLRYFTVGIPFLNARMQSLYRLGREVAEAPPNQRARIMHQAALRFSIRGVTALTIPALVLYFFNKDDERYQEMPDYIRDLYFVFFTGDGEDDYFLIPKPFEVGTMFATMPERIMEAIEKEQGSELVDAIGFALTSTFKVDPELQIIKPLLEVQDNEKWTGAPIVPAELEKVEPQEQYRTYTSDAMIALGRKLGISPLKAEHIVKGYLGQTGNAILNVADTLVGDLSQGGVEPARGWEDAWWNPISSLVQDGPMRRTNSEQDFYDFLKLAREAGNTQYLITQRSPERLAEYLSSDETMQEIALGGAFNQVQKKVSELNNLRDRIASSAVLSAEEKDIQMDEIQRQKNQLFRDFMMEVRPQIQGLSDERQTAP